MAVRGSFLYGPSTRTLILSLLIATPADLPSFWICLFFSICPLVYIHDSDTLTQFPRHISFYTTITVLVLYGRDGILGYITPFLISGGRYINHYFLVPVLDGFNCQKRAQPGVCILGWQRSPFQRMDILTQRMEE